MVELFKERCVLRTHKLSFWVQVSLIARPGKLVYVSLCYVLEKGKYWLCTRFVKFVYLWYIS